jgi:CRP-like cAMP-binding protein
VEPALDALSRLPLFGGVPPNSLDQLWRQGVAVQVPRGTEAFRQGAPADHCLLVVSGRLKAWAEQGDREQPVSDVFPGELVGEAALFDPSATRTATLRAWEDSLCLRLTPADLAQLSGSPALAALQRHMLHTTARRLRTTHHAVRKQLKRRATATGHSAAPSTWQRLARFFGASSTGRTP